MPSPAFGLLELLAAVQLECVVSEVLARLESASDGRAIHRATVWRALGRAETLGLVTRAEGRGVEVWELTNAGRRTLAGDGDRPECPECGRASGSRLGGGALELVPRWQLSCRACGHHWTPTAFDRERAEARDRSMSSASDVLAEALARHEARARGERA